MKGRLIVIGDVHGCYLELEKLLNLLRLEKHDIVMFLGDLVNRGPDSHFVVKMAREIGAFSVMGNHEHRLLKWRQRRRDEELKECDFVTIQQLTLKDWEFLEKMQIWHHLPELETILVHGGFLPDVPWKKQPVEVVTRIQMVDENGFPQKRARAPLSPHWSALWRGPKFVLFGHTPFPEVQREPFAWGIDTGCVYGGHLTACILPERRLVQVVAGEPYIFPKTGAVAAGD
jgi:predicted phosphodiesterase